MIDPLEIPYMLKAILIDLKRLVFRFSFCYHLKKKVMDEKVGVYRVFIFNAPENDALKYEQDPFLILIPNFTVKVDF